VSTAVVEPGACGLRTTVRVERDPGGDGKTYRLTVETACEHVRRLAEALPTLGRMDALVPIRDNPVYAAAGTRLKHAACPVPSAILKALEVAAGLNVPKDATITFT